METMKRKSRLLIFIFVTAISSLNLSAKITVDKMFSNNMVVQRGKPIHIWGTAESGEKVRVAFAGQRSVAVADTTGRWSVVLKQQPASIKPRNMQISARNGKIVLENILVGDVWLASGQSNMQYSMTEKMPQPAGADSLRMRKDYEKANDKLVRLLLVKKDLSTPALPTDGWKTVEKESLKDFSAVAYYFAHNLADSLNVPVGIIASSWGGSPIESWIPEDVYKISSYYNDERNMWKFNRCAVGDKFLHMIKPLVGMQISGFLWYQGEANLTWHETSIYGEKQKSLVECWRKAWNDDCLPFYYVQITPYTYSVERYRRFPLTWDLEAEFWKAQQSCLVLDNMAMVYTTDLTDNVSYLHPSYKWKVGERLARIALNKKYNRKDVVCDGPVVEKVSVNRSSNTVTISFSNANGGLRTRDGKEPDWFYVRDKRGRFAPALSAHIEGNKVVVKCKSINEKAGVRFGWDETATPNLENGYGLPAAVFMKECE